MTPLNTTSPAPAGAAACPDTAPAESKGALLRVLGDASDSIEAMRGLIEPLAHAAPALQVMADALALLAWRVEIGRGIAAGLPHQTDALALLAARDLLTPLVAARTDAGAA